MCFIWLWLASFHMTIPIILCRQHNCIHLYGSIKLYLACTLCVLSNLSIDGHPDRSFSSSWAISTRPKVGKADYLINQNSKQCSHSALKTKVLCHCRNNMLLWIRHHGRKESQQQQKECYTQACLAPHVSGRKILTRIFKALSQKIVWNESCMHSHVMHHIFTVMARHSSVLGSSQYRASAMGRCVKIFVA